MQISSLGDVTLRHKSRYVVINGQLFVTYGRKQLQTSSGKDHYSADDTANKNSPKSGAPVLKLFLKEVQINTSFFPMSEACIKLFYYFEGNIIKYVTIRTTYLYLALSSVNFCRLSRQKRKCYIHNILRQLNNQKKNMK